MQKYLLSTEILESQLFNGLNAIVFIRVMIMDDLKMTKSCGNMLREQ